MILSAIRRAMKRCAYWAGDCAAPCARSTQCCAGADEFGVAVSGFEREHREAASKARRVAQKIVVEMSRPLRIEGHRPICSCSIGITVFSNHEISATEIMQEADIAIHQAKQAGRKSISFFSQVLKSSVRARAAIGGVCAEVSARTSSLSTTSRRSSSAGL